MYTPSVNIEYTSLKDFNYIITPNARTVYNEIVTRFASGIHSFNIIGSYGTGKSSFLFELNKELVGRDIPNGLVLNKKIFNKCSSFSFLNVVGDYEPLAHLLLKKLSIVSKGNGVNAIDALDSYYKKVHKEGKFLFICLDEFGKILEHAVHNIERESYFLQQLAEYVNQSDKDIILLATLHQNFSTYAQRLTDVQRDEWGKVKGRFCDIVFHEPIEQLLYLAAVDLGNENVTIRPTKELDNLYKVAIKSKVLGDVSLSTIECLYPLEPFSAMALTTAIQRYGQNERSLFSYLQSDGTGSLKDFQRKNHRLFNLADVYDYVQYNFYSVLSQVNSDTANWNALNIALERAQSGIIPDKFIDESLLVIKTIGLINIFSSGTATLSNETLLVYSSNALGIGNSQDIMDRLVKARIIRYANYRSRYIIYDGTDVDIEGELYKIGTIIPMPEITRDTLQMYFHDKYQQASAYYYQTGNPRYFKYIIADHEIDSDERPKGQIDGFICLVFLKDSKDFTSLEKSSKADKNPIVYVVFKDYRDIRKHLWEIKKLDYLKEQIDNEDKVALKEIQNQYDFEEKSINYAVNTSLFDEDITTWIYKGDKQHVTSYHHLNQLISYICKDVYNKAPIVRCEMLNKENVSTSISTARKKLFDRIINHSTEKDLGFELGKFPPEKTIYEILFKETGLHCKISDSQYGFRKPVGNGIKDLWQESVAFLDRAKEKPHKIDELVNILREQPFKLKKGLLDLWIPAFLLIEQSKFALYSDGAYIPVITKEVIDILQKSTTGFTIKAFEQSPINKEIFGKYRLFLRKAKPQMIDKKIFNNTYNQFFLFYNHLNQYAKHTRKFDHVETVRFRDVLANASDPEKSLFIDIPEALGLSNINGRLNENEDDDFLACLRLSVHELVICYDQFIERIEKSVIKYLGIPYDFESYKPIIEKRYEHVKKYLLSSKAKIFYERIMSPSKSKKDFYERIGSIVFDKPLENIKDDEEEHLIDNILYFFRELDRYVEISRYDESSNNIFNFELASSQGDLVKQKTFVLSKSKEEEMKDLEEQLSKLMIGRTDVGACAMLQILSKIIKGKNNES